MDAVSLLSRLTVPMLERLGGSDVPSGLTKDDLVAAVAELFGEPQGDRVFVVGVVGNQGDGYRVFTGHVHPEHIRDADVDEPNLKPVALGHAENALQDGVMRLP